ncbi:hypothetical protein NMD1_02417 [Novosphingobium sp. MD-1]|nr:hypothetical protein NMD1_02417 [Novosphingobium sp. MD-1]
MMAGRHDRLLARTGPLGKRFAVTIICQGACKPGSVPPTVCHSAPYRRGQPFLSATRCRAAPATNPDIAGPKTLARNTPAGCPARRPYSVLLRVGFAVPLPLPVARCALAAPFHPCLRLATHRRSALCGTFPDPRLREGRRALPATLFRGARTFLGILR